MCLPDTRTLKESGVFDMTKLFLVVKKEDAGSSGASSSSLGFWDELHYFLLKHYRNADAKLVLEELRKVMYYVVWGG